MAQSKAVLSSRFFHPINTGDTLNTVKFFKQAKADRIDWLYCEDAGKLKILKDNNIKFSLAMHPEIPDSGEYTTAKYRIKDINGKPYIASWMKTWNMKNPYWGCVNNPDFQQLFYKTAVRYLNLGAYAIFVDDALFNVQLQKERPNEYGCFCNYCLDGFRTYLNAKGPTQIANFDYKAMREQLAKCMSDDKKGLLTSTSAEKNLINQYQDYQFKSVVTFLTNWKVKLKAFKSDVIILANNSNGSWNDIFSVFDGGIAELSEDKLNKPYLDSVFAVVAARHKTQIFSLVSNDIQLQYYLMAYNYINGHDYLLPWDIFVPQRQGSAERFYGKGDEISKLVDVFGTEGPQSKTFSEDKDSWSVTFQGSNSKKYRYVLSKFPKSKLGPSLKNRVTATSLGLDKLIIEKKTNDRAAMSKAKDSAQALQIYQSN